MAPTACPVGDPMGEAEVGRLWGAGEGKTRHPGTGVPSTGTTSMPRISSISVPEEQFFPWPLRKVSILPAPSTA